MSSPTQSKDAPKPSIANFTPPNALSTSNQGQPQRKPSQKKTSIALNTTLNLQQKSSANQSFAPPKTSKQQQQNNPNPAHSVPLQSKKPARGGTLDRQLSENAPSDIDTTTTFSLGQLLDKMSKGIRLNKLDLQKILNNFKMYVKKTKQTFSLDLFQQTIKIETPKGPEEAKILKFSYISSMESKQKNLLNIFWCEIIKSLFQNFSFLSNHGCYEIVKLHIALNKQIYCQKENQGTFDSSKFMSTQIFSITNDRITVKRQSQLFKTIEKNVQQLALALFKGMRNAFKELNLMKSDPIQVQKYNTVFQDLQASVENKRKVISNLLSAFENLTVQISEQEYEKYISFLECVIESVWHYYQAESQYFKQEQCINFIKFLDENYIFFNSYGMGRSDSTKRLVQNVEKIVLGFLFRSPFQFKKWSINSSRLIINSKLELFEPFKYLLEYGRRQEQQVHPRINYPLRGLHWNEFIDSVIKLRNDDPESIDFIISALESFLMQNADIFWVDPSDFENFCSFSIKYNDIAGKNKTPQQIREVILNTMRIATSLMGQNSQQLKQKQQNWIDGDIDYPQNKKAAFALHTYNEFPQLFIKWSKNEFMSVICDQLKEIMILSGQTQSQEGFRYDIRVLKPQDVILTYFLKLLSSEPTLFFELRKNMKGVKETDLVSFLIFKTIKNPKTSTEVLDLAFTTLDSLLIKQQTKFLIQQILGLDQSPSTKPLAGLAQRLFTNPKAVTFLSRHCNILINNGYQSREWTRELLKAFYKKCQDNQGSGMVRQQNFVVGYSELLSNIVGRLNLGRDEEILQLRPYINVSFIVDAIRHYLKFDDHRNYYINVAVEKRSKEKIEALMHSIRAYNSVLLYCLKSKNTKLAQTDTYAGSQFKSKSSRQAITQFISPFQARQLGINDKQFQLQVKSVSEETTSYANALSFIVVSSTKQQRKILKSVNTDYESLIFQTIDNLIKLNPKQELARMFTIRKCTLSLAQTIKPFEIKSLGKSLLIDFTQYIEQSLNEVGIEIIVFGNLIPENQKLRRIIDKVRNKLENPTLRLRIKPYLVLKLLSTLSRYFRSAMLQISLHNKHAFNELQIQEHFEYLVQCIVELISPFKSTQKPHELIILDDTLANLYGGFLTVHTFSIKQFVKWIKNYHVVLLNDANLKYLRNANKRQLQPDQSTYLLGQEYFKVLTLLLNCDQYLHPNQFKIIAQIRDLPETLSTFILNIALYSELSVLPESLCQILIEILIMSINFYSLISTNQQLKISLFTDVLNSVKEKSIKPTTNLILLEISLFNELSVRYSASEIDLNNINQWPLQMNCIDANFSTPTVKKIIEFLKKSSLNTTSFVSICNGLLFLIQNSQRLEQSKPIFTKDLFDVYKHFAYQTESPQIQQNLNNFQNSMAYPKAGYTKKQQSIYSYKKVWVLELLLAILTSSQMNDKIDKIDKVRLDFQNVFIGDESVLKRFGLLMRKVAFFEAQTYMTWLPHLDLCIQESITPGQSISFAEKLELNQLLKMFNFILANQSWTGHFADSLTELIEAFVSYRNIFGKLLSSSKKPKAFTLQQSILEGTSLTKLAQGDHMMRSAIYQFERERLQGNSFKSTNCFELMHEILNIELSTQYSLICATIAQVQHLAMFKKNLLLSDAAKWNIVLLDLAESMKDRYIQIIKQEKIVKTILNGFRESYYLASDKNIQISTEMLFTNSESLSCCLNGSFELLVQVNIETMELLLKTIQEINKKLQKQLHSDYKHMNERFNKVVDALRRNDKQTTSWAAYEPSEKKAIVAQTIRSQITKTAAQKSQKITNGLQNNKFL